MSKDFSFVNSIAVTNSLGTVVGTGTNFVWQFSAEITDVGTQIAHIGSKITTIEDFANVFRAKFTNLIKVKIRRVLCLYIGRISNLNLILISRFIWNR